MPVLLWRARLGIIAEQRHRPGRCPLNVRPCVEALAMRVEHVVHDVRDDVVRMRDIAPHRVAILEHVPLADGESSEEHTSELQSLMRISYDVFCLKKKNIH